MGKGGSKQVQTTTQSLDPQSQAQVAKLRQMALGGANVALQGPPGGGSFFTGPLTQTPGEMAAGFMSPYQTHVVDATRREFDHLRDQTLTGANQEATLGGALGGSRQAVMAGARLGEVDRAQGSTIANLLNSGYQTALGQGLNLAQFNQGLSAQQAMEPLFRQQQALGMMNLGMGPMGYNTTTTTTGQGGKNRAGGALGGALTGAQIGSMVPGIGTAIGAGVGGLLGLFG